ncbi:hypothetical protein MSG28_000844 [Choristoneura fumiferana]|uniref:Uncharacterized protein n=1 Tax=Choristoneura fumiferana TaxID=7141 RepID=A0ACC0K370_CHOFU|nr:hypothetical protein MSG28_000844 [Choristoneura fumiferana]
MALYKSSANNRYIVRLLLIFSFTDTVSCYEKTLRKIVRNQSKMVQTPFDDMGGTLTWSNVSHPLRIHEAHMFPFHAQVKTMFSSRQRPKSAIIASMETGRGKSYSRTRIAHTEKLLPIELRLTRNTYQNISMASPIKNEPFFSDKNLYNVSPPVAAIVENFRKIPSSNFFPPVDENVMQNPVPRPVTKEKTIIIPDYREHTKRYDTLQVRGLIRPNVTKNTKPEDAEVKYSTESTEIDDGDKADYLIEEPSGSQPRSFVYSRNISANQLKCTVVKTMNADIDAQMKFSEFDIEEFKQMVEKQTGACIKVLRSDNGTEFCSNQMASYLKKSGIVHQRTIVYTPEQNGLCERQKARCQSHSDVSVTNKIITSRDVTIIEPKLDTDMVQAVIEEKPDMLSDTEEECESTDSADSDQSQSTVVPNDSSYVVDGRSHTSSSDETS